MKNIVSKIVASAAVVSLLAMALPALAAPAHNNIGKILNPKLCDAKGAPVLDVTFKVTNDADSGVAGNAWANDSYNKHIQVWTQTDGTYCAIVKYEGQFVTNAGASPQNTGTLAAGIKGTFEGGYQATFDGTFTPTLKTKGNIGSYDYALGAFDWVSAYFSGNTTFAQPYWAWQYKAGKHGTWLNASTGNSGDII